MTTLGFYFPLSKPAANALRARLNQIAAEHGYTATRGATAGEGNLVELLLALDAGEVATVLLPDTQLQCAIDALEALSTADPVRNEWAGTIAESLHQARERTRAAERAELEEDAT